MRTVDELRGSVIEVSVFPNVRGVLPSELQKIRRQHTSPPTQVVTRKPQEQRL